MVNSNSIVASTFISAFTVGAHKAGEVRKNIAMGLGNLVP